MACRLLGVKPLSEPMLTPRNKLQWNFNQNTNEISINIGTFYSIKCIWKCRLENGGHFVATSMCYRHVPCAQWALGHQQPPHRFCWIYGVIWMVHVFWNRHIPLQPPNKFCLRNLGMLATRWFLCWRVCVEAHERDRLPFTTHINTPNCIKIRIYTYDKLFTLGNICNMIQRYLVVYMWENIIMW